MKKIILEVSNIDNIDLKYVNRIESGEIDLHDLVNKFGVALKDLTPALKSFEEWLIKELEVRSELYLSALKQLEVSNIPNDYFPLEVLTRFRQAIGG